jgi:hypothetical protein
LGLLELRKSVSILTFGWSMIAALFTKLTPL